MLVRWTGWALGGFLVLAGLGCNGDDDGEGDDGGTGRDAGRDAAVDAGVDAGEDAAVACSAVAVAEVHGGLVDPDGAGLEGATVGLCIRAEQHGRVTFVCLRPVTAGPDGRWTVTVPEALQCVHSATVRLAAEGFATTYCPVTLDGGQPTIEAPEWRLLPMPADPPTWGPGDEEINLAADDGATVSLRPSDLDPELDPAAVRFRRVDPVLERPCFLPDGREPENLYVLEPESAVVRPGGLPARLRAGGGSPEGTEVSLYLLGGLHTSLDGAPVAEGAWVPFADSVVEDEAVVPTPDGDGIPQLGWLGVERR